MAIVRAVSMGIVVALVAACAAVLSSASTAFDHTALRADANKVVCVKFNSSGSVRKYRTRPRQCVFVKRGEKPFGYTTQTTKKLRWHRWDSGQARAKGKILISTVGPRPVRVKLTRPRPGCEEARAFTKAHFNVPKAGKSLGMRLDRCP